ncbi:MAG: hypothetical protein QXN05_04190 [Acidilobaceae archaeon]
MEYVDELRKDIEKRGKATVLDKVKLVNSIRKFADIDRLSKDVRPVNLLIKFMLKANIDAVKEFLRNSLLVGSNTLYGHL